MLKFRNTFIIYIILTIVMGLWTISHPFPLIPFLIISLLFLSLIAFGSARINSGFFLKAICKGKEGEKKIAISFDDGPHPDTTGEILEILNEHKVKAAFFCIGKNIEANPGIVEWIDREGHILGNHSYSHAYLFDFYSWSRIASELKKTNNFVFEITGKQMKFFRPPYGVTTPNIARAVRENRFNSIGWSVRSMDTIVKDKEKLVDTVLNKIQGGDIILFHDTMKITGEMLGNFIHKVKHKGFEIVRLDQLINIPAYD